MDLKNQHWKSHLLWKPKKLKDMGWYDLVMVARPISNPRFLICQSSLLAGPAPSVIPGVWLAGWAYLVVPPHQWSPVFDWSVGRTCGRGTRGRAAGAAWRRPSGRTAGRWGTTCRWWPGSSSWPRRRETAAGAPSHAWSHAPRWRSEVRHTETFVTYFSSPCCCIRQM